MNVTRGHLEDAVGIKSTIAGDYIAAIQRLTRKRRKITNDPSSPVAVSLTDNGIAVAAGTLQSEQAEDLAAELLVLADELRGRTYLGTTTSPDYNTAPSGCTRSRP